MVTGIRRFWKSREAIVREIKNKIDEKKDSDEEDKK